MSIKLNYEDQVRRAKRIDAMLKEGHTPRAIASLFRISPETVRKIARGETWGEQTGRIQENYFFDDAEYRESLKSPEERAENERIMNERIEESKKRFLKLREREERNPEDQAIRDAWVFSEKNDRKTVLPEIKPVVQTVVPAPENYCNDEPPEGLTLSPDDLL